MQKIGVIGSSSKIGKRLIQRGCTPLDCDVTKSNTIERVLARKKPDIVVNLASYSDPDFCELKENFEEVLAVNVRGLYNVATLAEKKSVPVVVFSTDHIFNGKTGWDKNIKTFTRRGPYKEHYPRAAPVNAYGVSKLGMETLAHAFDNVKIVRTSYCFDKKRLHLDIELIRKGIPSAYPTFIQRSFMHTEHFVDTFVSYLHRFYEMPKVLHISGSRTISWYDFMLALTDFLDLDANKIFPRKKKDINYAPRPHKCGLDVSLSAKLGLPQYSYEDGLLKLNEESQ